MSKSDIKIYWAAPLFNDMERSYNSNRVFQLEHDGFSVFLPQRDAGEMGIHNTNEERIATRSKDIEALEDCDVVIATLEGEAFDPGTVYEIGYAQAKGKTVVILCNDARWHNGMYRNAMLSTCHVYTFLSWAAKAIELDHLNPPNEEEVSGIKRTLTQAGSNP